MRTKAFRGRFNRWLGAGLPAILLVPAPAWAAGPEGLSRSGPVLFALAVLVAAAKAGGLVAERWKQPAVLGELLVGIGLANLVPLLLGEHGVSFIRADLTLLVLAQVGVLILLFDVGLEADLRALSRVGLTSLLVATTGVGFPSCWGGPPRGGCCRPARRSCTSLSEPP